ncbi:hypothetical protein GCM10022250_43940 [Flavobacterium chungbukense]|uniref:Uncharacterized protein n=1 Tax=Flavobacterium chungbukense TaxID=877464 RepID=A0ABP7YVN2_9FLAO
MFLHKTQLDSLVKYLYKGFYAVLSKLSVCYIIHSKIQKGEERKVRQNKNPEGNLQPIKPLNSLQDPISCLRFPIGILFF